MTTPILTALVTTTLLSLTIASAPAEAKTIKACQKEWQADKAANQAAGKTEKAYVAECRSTAAAAKPAAAPGDKGSDKGSNY